MIKINRTQKQKIYEEKYRGIPLDYNERLKYMTEFYHISENRMNDILLKRDKMLYNLEYYNYKVIVLYEEPEGASRPRVRIQRNNYNRVALSNPDFVHVYVPNAHDDQMYMKRLTETELCEIDKLIYTPCNIDYTVFLKTPTYMNITDKFLCEIGIIRPQLKKPDWDNIGKKYCDMYNSNVWLDDALVIDGAVHKYYSILPRIEINLQYLNCLYTKNDFTSTTSRKDFIANNETRHLIQYLDSKGDITNGF